MLNDNKEAFNGSEHDHFTGQPAPSNTGELPYTEQDLEKLRQKAKELFLRELDVTEEEAQQLADEEVDALKEDMFAFV